jgi:hypothetical protein
MAATPKLVTDDKLTRETIRRLAGTLEPVAFFAQAISIAIAAVVDDVTPAGRHLLYGLILGHLAIAGITWRVGGPFTRGGPWIVLWAGLVAAVPLLMGHITSTPYSYAGSINCVQLCTYPAAPVALFSFYPWIGKEQIQLRLPVELFILILIVAEPLLVVERLTGDELTLTSYISIGISGVWVVLTFIGGKGLGRMCRMAVGRVSEARSAAFDEIIDFLHTDIQGAIVAIQRNSGDHVYVTRRLRNLDNRCDVYRQEMRAVRNEEELVEIVPLLVRASEGYFDALHPLSIHRADWLRAKRSIGSLMASALGNLLKNCVEHGASSAEIDFVYEAGCAILGVKDDGPGFNPEIMNDMDTNLSRMREDAKFFGGDLTYTSNEGGGAYLHLKVPIEQ